MLQLDEEVEGMQSKVLTLEKEIKELRDYSGNDGTSHGGPSKTTKEKPKLNGPVVTPSKEKRSQDS